MRATAVFALVLSALGVSCGAPGLHPGAPVAGTRPAVVPAKPPLPPLTPAEEAIETELRAIVSYLAGDVGERHAAKSWNLAEATDDLARRLEKMGYPVRRQGFAVGEDVFQNVEVSVPGKERGEENVVVAAHFDTTPGSPGADDDASGVAVVTSLARIFREKKPSRSLRFVLFANGAPPNAATPNAGSLAYAKDLKRQAVNVVAVLNLQGVGFFSEAERSQKQPTSGTAYPGAGNFVLVASDARGKELVGKVHASLAKQSSPPAVAETNAGTFSDDWSFAEVGMPVVTLTDTGALRNPHHGLPSDLPGTLDFERMARLVTGLCAVLEDLTGTSSAPTSESAEPGPPDALTIPVQR